MLEAKTTQDVANIQLLGRQLLARPFVGQEDYDDIAPKINGVLVPFHAAQYASHARVLRTGPRCVEAEVGMIVLYYFQSFDEFFVWDEKRRTAMRVYRMYEDSLYGFFVGWA